MTSMNSLHAGALGAGRIGRGNNLIDHGDHGVVEMRR